MPNRSLREISGFILILSAASIPFYVAGPVIGSLAGATGANLPGAALAVVCPSIAAVVMAARTGSVRELLAGFTKVPRSLTYGVVSIAAMPAVVMLSAVLTGGQAGFSAPPIGGALLAVLFLLSAAAEQTGWTGFLLPRFLPLAGELGSGLIIGSMWALWHVIPDIQAGHPAGWILGQSVFTVVFRVLLDRLTLGTGSSLWPAIVCHASYNLAWALSPNAGYNPWVAAALTAVIAGLLFAFRQLPPHHGSQISSARSTEG